MRTLQLNKREVLCVPDQDSNLGQMAAYDTVGWVQIGHIGSANTLLFGNDEWVAFVKFVYELDRHMAERGVGAYAPEEASEE